MPKTLGQAALRDYKSLKEVSERLDSTGYGQITPSSLAKDGVTYIASVDPENEAFIKFRSLDPMPSQSFLKSEGAEGGTDATHRSRPATSTSAYKTEQSSTPKITKTMSKSKFFKLKVKIPPREPQTIQCKMSIAELKFHIALPDYYNKGDANFEAEEALREKAWRIIADIIMTPPGNIKAFKLLRPNKRFCQIDKTYDPKTMQPNETQQYGKDVAIYAREDDSRTPEEWVALMKEISDALSEAGIPERLPLPKGRERKTTPLGDSPYICYRYGHCPSDELEYRIEEAIKTTHFERPAPASSSAEMTNK